MTETEPSADLAGEQPLTVRPRRARVVAGCVAVLLVVVFAVVAVLLRAPDGEKSSTGVYFRPSDQVAMLGLGVLLAVGALLFTRPRVRADATGIEVRNIFTTQRFAWTDVLYLSFPDGAAWARLELPDDEYISVMAVQAADREHAVQAMRSLRGLHRKATEA
ncbi:PH domain-containing protein [Goodfellowiella coeruleoviolacea]|uniref:PH domain-containing protein n=1 Tax=Goodfellowiella coeruleoviolacea TaxID=334858 RepID=A0AAE3GMC6_9PSEU|nr:PH domain-containing protein [Goodfellowiella coeruleoviolacea]MCP2170220.1 PH domain-containing protein [Goodfellowiella coeruleoviolacea]